jgi:glycerol-3-phosphate acyltransferase PlsY
MTGVLVALTLVPFYLLGAFPTGYLMARVHGVDITAVGSGNVGATNVSRVVGKKAGIVTLLMDMFKGAFGVAVASGLSASPLFVALCAITVVAGHCFSVPPYLKGGKGVATALGVILVLSAQTGVVALVVFTGVFVAKRIVSLSSICATLAVPAYAMAVNLPNHVVGAEVCIAVLLVYRHRENLQRLIEGREPIFTTRKQ